MSIIDKIDFADNESNARQMYEGRKFYKHHDWFGQNYLTIDMWVEKNYSYGKVNRAGVPVSINEENLKPIPASKTMLCVDFVADAFIALQDYFEKAKVQKKIAASNSEILKIEPIRAWTSNSVIYHDVLNALYDTFVLLHLNARHRHGKVRNFDDFANEFLSFYSNFQADLPMTKTGFLKSQFNPIMSSGLIIEIQKKDFSNDDDKVDYIHDKNFLFLKTAATRFGFMLDRNGPWRLVFDVAQYQSQKRMAAHGIASAPGSASDLFEQYYKTSYSEDLELLTTYLSQMYLSYVTAYPSVCGQSRPSTPPTMPAPPVTPTGCSTPCSMPTRR
jgi:hypothetical protein